MNNQVAGTLPSTAQLSPRSIGGYQPQGSRFLDAYLDGAAYTRDSAEQSSVSNQPTQNRQAAFLPNAGMGGNNMSRAAEEYQRKTKQILDRVNAQFTGML